MPAKELLGVSMSTLSTDLTMISGVIQRLDRLYHVRNARLEVQQVINESVFLPAEDHSLPALALWAAHIVAEPLKEPVFGIGSTPEMAINHLAGRALKISWRKDVRR